MKSNLNVDSKKTNIDYTKLDIESLTQKAQNGMFFSKGDPNAQVEMALRFEKGINVKQNRMTAFEWYHKAGEQEHPEAQYKVAEYYVDPIFEKQNLIKAAKWFERAAKQGHTQAQAKLSICYREGQGIKKDIIQATLWDAKARSDSKLVFGDISADDLKKLLIILKNEPFTHLNLYTNWDDEKICVLATILKSTQLTHLDLSENNFTSITYDAMRTFATALQYSALIDLNLDSTIFFDSLYGESRTKRLEVLMRGLEASHLTHLSLKNGKGADGVAVSLASSAIKNTHLTHLIYTTATSILVEITADAACWAILEALENSSLRHLDLRGCRIKDNGAKHLAEWLPKSELTYLDLSHCEIKDDGAKHLAASLPKSKLTYLDLSYHKYKPDKRLPLPEIQSTYLDLINRQSIGIETTKLLMSSVKNSLLTRLTIRIDEEIKGKDANDIAIALQNSRLTYLDLSSDDISEDCVKAIAKTLKNSQLTSLSLRVRDKDINERYEGQKSIKDTVMSLGEMVLSIEKIEKWLNKEKVSIKKEENKQEYDDKNSGVKALAEAIKDSQLTRLHYYIKDVNSENVQKLAFAVAEMELQGRLIEVTGINTFDEHIAKERVQAKKEAEKLSLTSEKKSYNKTTLFSTSSTSAEIKLPNTTQQTSTIIQNSLNINSSTTCALQKLETSSNKEALARAEQQREIIRNNEVLSEYYYVFSRELTADAIACLGIKSEKIKNDEFYAISLLPKGLDKISDWVSIPFSKLVTDALGIGIDLAINYDKKTVVNNTTNFYGTLKETAEIIELLSCHLTLHQANKIKALKEKNDTGFFISVYNSFQNIDTNTPLREFAANQAKLLIKKIEKGELKPKPQAKDLEGLLKVILGENFNLKDSISQITEVCSLPHSHQDENISMPLSTSRSTNTLLGVSISPPTLKP